MQSDIPFLRTRKPPGPQGCLMEKPLNFLHPLGNFEGCSRHHAPVLKRFVVLMSDHTHRSQRVNDTKKVPAICTKGKKPWEIHHDFSTLIAESALAKMSLRDKNVMRHWATGHGKAMQCITKYSAGTLPVNRYHMNYLLERKLRWNTMTRTELGRRQRRFCWSWQQCDKFSVEINSHSLWKGYLLVA